MIIALGLLIKSQLGNLSIVSTLFHTNSTKKIKNKVVRLLIRNLNFVLFFKSRVYKGK